MVKQVFSRRYGAMRQLIFPLGILDDSHCNAGGVGDMGFSNDCPFIQIRTQDQATAGQNVYLRADPGYVTVINLAKRSGWGCVCSYIDGAHLQKGYFGIGDFTTKVIGFELDPSDSKVYGRVKDSSESTVQLDNWSADFKEYHWILYPGDRVDFYINGILKGTLATNIPTTGITRLLDMWLSVTGDSSFADHFLRLGNPVYWRDY